MTTPDRETRTVQVQWAESAIREAVDRVTEWLAPYRALESTGEVIYRANGIALLVSDLTALRDATRTLLDHARPAVSPAPDTEALRQQVAAVLEERIGDNSDLYETVDDVLALPWIKYAAGQRHVVTMHEQNNAALAKTNREWAEEHAGLRADLDPTTDHLTWSVVHVPPGTTDPEDRDTPITPGWWVLGVDSEAPEHPVVQVHLGETLPPTTGPAPAAADGARPKRSEWLCPSCKKPPTPFGDDQDWMCDEHKSTPPAAPQAPAEPTASVKLFNRLISGASVVNGVPQTPAAREDTAPPDDYGDNLTAGFLRPSAPTEEKQ